MCENCADKTQRLPAGSPRRRLKLWEIDSQWHCTIVGTCLSLGELKAVASRLGVRFNSERPSDYELHASVITLIGREKVVGKALHKLLDRKHGAMVARCSKLEGPDALRLAWTDALGRGEVGAACWALLSHPDGDGDLRNAIFGDIHMLSHQVGAASRADIRRIHALETEKCTMEARLSRQQERLRHEVGRRNTLIRELRQRLECEIAETRRLGHAAQAASEMERLRRLMKDLERGMEVETERRLGAEGRMRETLLKLHDMGRALSDAMAETGHLREELAASEGRLAGALGAEGDGLGDCNSACAQLDLCGRCILFVGGRSQHVPHFRKLVEECNGIFAHHDGGWEESMGRLHGLFGRADAVLFPVDGVSHGAHDEVKRLCRRWEKPFVPVRHSGLGAFMRALSTLASNRPETGA